MKMFKLVALGLLLPALSFAQAANISTTDATLSGVNLATAAVSAVSTTYFTNDGYTLFHVKSGGSPISATVISTQTSMSKAGFGTIALSNNAVAIASGTNIILGPFPMSRWNTPNGTVGVSFTSVTGVSVTAIRDTTDGR